MEEVDGDDDRMDIVGEVDIAADNSEDVGFDDEEDMEVKKCCRVNDDQ